MLDENKNQVVSLEVMEELRKKREKVLSPAAKAADVEALIQAMNRRDLWYKGPEDKEKDNIIIALIETVIQESADKIQLLSKENFDLNRILQGGNEPFKGVLERNIRPLLPLPAPPPGRPPLVPPPPPGKPPRKPLPVPPPLHQRAAAAERLAEQAAKAKRAAEIKRGHVPKGAGLVMEELKGLEELKRRKKKPPE